MFRIELVIAALTLMGLGTASLWWLRRQPQPLLSYGLVSFGVYNGFLALVNTLWATNSIVAVVIPCTVGAYLALAGLLIPLLVAEEGFHPGRALLLGLAGLWTTSNNAFFAAGTLTHVSVWLVELAAIAAVAIEMRRFVGFVNERLQLQPPATVVAVPVRSLQTGTYRSAHSARASRAS